MRGDDAALTDRVAETLKHLGSGLAVLNQTPATRNNARLQDLVAQQLDRQQRVLELWAAFRRDPAVKTQLESLLDWIETHAGAAACRCGHSWEAHLFKRNESGGYPCRRCDCIAYDPAPMP